MRAFYDFVDTCTFVCLNKSILLISLMVVRNDDYLSGSSELGRPFLKIINQNPLGTLVLAKAFDSIDFTTVSSKETAE